MPSDARHAESSDTYEVVVGDHEFMVIGAALDISDFLRHLPRLSWQMRPGHSLGFGICRLP